MPESCREVIASLDDPANVPPPPESAVELAAAIGRALPNDARPDVRAWALRRVPLAELGQVLGTAPLEPEFDALAAKGVFSISRAITWPPHSSAKAQVEDVPGEQAH